MNYDQLNNHMSQIIDGDTFNNFSPFKNDLPDQQDSNQTDKDKITDKEDDIDIYKLQIRDQLSDIIKVLSDYRNEVVNLNINGVDFLNIYLTNVEPEIRKDLKNLKELLQKKALCDRGIKMKIFRPGNVLSAIERHKNVRMDRNLKKKYEERVLFCQQIFELLLANDNTLNSHAQLFNTDVLEKYKSAKMFKSDISNRSVLYLYLLHDLINIEIGENLNKLRNNRFKSNRYNFLNNFNEYLLFERPGFIADDIKLNKIHFKNFRPSLHDFAMISVLILKLRFKFLSTEEESNMNTEQDYSEYKSIKSCAVIMKLLHILKAWEAKRIVKKDNKYVELNYWIESSYTQEDPPKNFILKSLDDLLKKVNVVAIESSFPTFIQDLLKVEYDIAYSACCLNEIVPAHSKRKDVKKLTVNINNDYI